MHKTCVRCGENKLHSEFYKEKRVADGLTARCKSCTKDCAQNSYENNKEVVKSRQKKKYCSVKRRERTLMENYGMTPSDYDEMYQQQQGACKICEKNFDQLCVDHCHNTGKVRGLLCQKCNKAIGLLGDNLNYLSNAITYIAEHAGDTRVECSSNAE